MNLGTPSLRIQASLLALAVLGASAFARQDLPLVFVVQKQTAEALGPDANDLNVTEAVADALRGEGRVSVVRWSQQDETFKNISESTSLTEGPTDELISEFARRLKARYILVVEASRLNGRLFPRADLFQVGRRGTLWTTGPKRSQGNESIVVMRGTEVDWAATGNSLAKTWALQLSQGPFKNLQREVEMPNPVAPTETGPRAPRVELGAAAGAEALDQAQKLIDSGRTDLAILYLRDAVDANPFEPERRILLSELLDRRGLALQSADEGRRAARLVSGKPDLWLVSAKSWLIAGKPDQAKLDVQEALARGADSPLAHRLLGDISLMQGDLTKARDEYSIALEKEDKPRTRLGLAVVFALTRQPELSQAILEPVKVGPEGLSITDYAFVLQLAEPSVRALAADLAAFMPRARVSKDKEALAKESEALVRRSSSLASLISLVKAPTRHNPSHEGRVLAHKLMLQASEEAHSFVKGTDPEAEMEVVLSLAEALRQLNTAVDAYRDEQEIEE
jgi:tetratricopeptide (TPR) repeat protein